MDLEKKMAEQEANEGKVQSSAVEKAKENLATRKLEEETRQVERRLATAESTEKNALRELRLARKKEAAQKAYLTAVSDAKTAFETDGDYRKYDKAIEKAEETRDETIAQSKREIYGDDYWRY